MCASIHQGLCHSPPHRFQRCWKRSLCSRATVAQPVGSSSHGGETEHLDSIAALHSGTYMASSSWGARRDYPSSHQDYEMLEEAGRGVSATVGDTLLCVAACRIGSPVPSVLDRAHTQVWKALCKPLNEVVAIKLLDLESVDCSLVGCCCLQTGCRPVWPTASVGNCRHGAGRNSTRSSDDAAAVAPQCAPAVLLLRAPPAPLDGDAVRGGWLRAQHHEVCLRGGVAVGRLHSTSKLRQA